MGKSTSIRGNFWLMAMAGAVLVVLVIVLGIGFFNAIYQTQLDSRRDFLTQQTALAARGLEVETQRFLSESSTLMDYLVDPDMDEEDFGDELTQYSRRIFNSFPQMIDSLWLDMGDSVLVFSLTDRNDFIRSRSSRGFPDPKSIENSVLVEDGNFKILYQVDLKKFTAEYVSHFYLDQGGGRFILMGNRLISLNEERYPNEFRFEGASLDPVIEEVTMGLKGIHQLEWINPKGELESGILVQYPFSFPPSKGSLALVFLVPTESLTSGVYSTFFFLFLLIALLLMSTVVFFVISLRNNLESERLQAENLQEISSLFEQQNLLMRELKGFVFFHNYKGEITHVSEEVKEILGHTKEEFISAFLPNATHREANQMKNLVKESITNKKDLIDLEYDFVKPSGEKLRLRIFSKLVFNSKGQFDGGFGLCSDITVQFQVREAILQSENRLRVLIQNIPDTIFLYDKTGKVVDFHVQESRHQRDTEEDLKGKHLAEIFPKEYEAELKLSFEKSIVQKNIQTLEIVRPTLGGDKHYELRIFPLDENQVMLISKDITSQKIWEKGLVEAMNAADKASRAKSEFLANMSHEIRTPMNGLLGIIDLLEGTKLDKIQKQYVDIVKNSGNSLLNIIRDILDYSKIEAGEIEILPLPFDPIQELYAQTEILSGLAKKKKIEVKIEHNLEGSTILEGDKNKINQVLLNLIGNALKFTPDKGKVEINMSLDELDEQLCFLSYQIKDSGIGISQENILNLTKPFYQVDSSISRNFQGTGLGLAIAKKIIEVLGGELRIESEEGKGSEFSFTVLVKRTEKKLEQADHQPLSWKDVKEMGAIFPLKILLAEDNELNLQLMKLMFEQLGFQFEVAKNGLEALEKVKENDFDVVLMDVQMPVLNGMETTQRIRELPGKEDLIIIGLSANVFEEDQKEALQAGMNDYLTKPIRLAVLADRLEYYFRKTRNKT